MNFFFLQCRNITLKIQWQKLYWQVHRLCCQVTFKVMFRADLKLAMYILSLLGVLVRGSFTNQMPGLTSWVLFKSLWSMSLCWGAWPQRDKKNTVYTIHRLETGVRGSFYMSSCLSQTYSQQLRQWPHADSLLLSVKTGRTGSLPLALSTQTHTTIPLSLNRIHVLARRFNQSTALLAE